MINGTMCFLRNRGKTLFLYRNGGEGDIHNGWYVPPGGRLERGERSIDCVLREFDEETGLKLINPKLRVIATFYNKGRILGGDKNQEDWRVEVYEANNFTGKLEEEHPKAKPVWVRDLTEIRMYPGDRKIFDLLDQKGVWEAILQYRKEDLARFNCKRVY
ncbi:NUDIX domain-containing protein [Candidatus Pacearchaeota archaeon]|nr:NUDIX domain-containing protein [Candidatus Pacearchaeota archaeon]